MTPQAFQELYAEMNGPLFGWMMKMTRKNRAVTEDIIGEAWLRAWTHRDECETVFKPWLYAIAHNVLAMSLRHEPMEPLTDEIEQTVADGRDVAQELENFEAWQRAAQAATLLSVKMQRALACQLRGLSLEETAKHLGIPQATAGTQIFHAKNKVRELCRIS